MASVAKEMQKALDRYKAGRWNGWVENRGTMERRTLEAAEKFGPFPEQSQSRQVRRRLERKGW